MYMYRSVPLCTPVCMCTCMHVYVEASPCAHLYACTHAHACVCMRVCACTCVSGCTHVCMDARMPRSPSRRLHRCTHAHMHPCTHAPMHPCTHAHMHTCTHAPPCAHAHMHTKLVESASGSSLAVDLLLPSTALLGRGHSLTCTYVCMRVRTTVMHARPYARVHVRTTVCTYVCMYVCMAVCMRGARKRALAPADGFGREANQRPRPMHMWHVRSTHVCICIACMRVCIMHAGSRRRLRSGGQRSAPRSERCSRGVGVRCGRARRGVG